MPIAWPVERRTHLPSFQNGEVGDRRGQGERLSPPGPGGYTGAELGEATRGAFARAPKPTTMILFRTCGTPSCSE